MSGQHPRLFADDGAIVHVGEGLVARTLPRPEWTHEAHLAATTWIMVRRPDIVPERDIGAIIAAYNVAVGGVNDDTQGYHETITQCFVRAARVYLARIGAATLVASVNGLLRSDEGRREWPLRFYSRDRLFSVAARREWIEPDLAPLPVAEVRTPTVPNTCR